MKFFSVLDIEYFARFQFKMVDVIILRRFVHVLWGLVSIEINLISLKLNYQIIS
jgi:hypothetical protein